MSSHSQIINRFDVNLWSTTSHLRINLKISWMVCTFINLFIESKFQHGHYSLELLSVPCSEILSFRRKISFLRSAMMLVYWAMWYDTLNWFGLICKIKKNLWDTIILRACVGYEKSERKWNTKHAKKHAKLALIISYPTIASVLSKLQLGMYISSIHSKFCLTLTLMLCHVVCQNPVTDSSEKKFIK